MSKSGDKGHSEKYKGALLSQASATECATNGSGWRSRRPEDLLQEIESLRARLSKLSEASRRVSENLDIHIVLQEVIDNARYLTGARYGALLTYGQSGDMQDFITSGLSPQEIERLNTSPRGLGLLGYMNEIQAPLRLADISSHPRSIGFPENHPPMKTFLGMPIRHQGEHVGNIYLTEKESGREFTSEDQDVLVMFASQAGAAISNARRYREEQQAKADLEALVNISPVGVLVFDAVTADLVSANDETRRIVGRLHATGRSLSHLLEVVSLRRPDGSDIPMDELPIMKALRTGDTVIADEVVIHPLDGREAITALVNARPIRREGGDIVSVVATIQNITPLEDLKRQRAEFLRNVSHELRTPLSAIKGSTSSLLGSTYPFDPSETRQFLRVIDEQSDQMRHLINNLVDMTQIEAGALSVNPEPTNIVDLLDQAREAYIRGAGEDNIRVELRIAPSLPRVMADERRVLQVLGYLLAKVSNRLSGSASVKITAMPRGSHVAVTLVSDGGSAASSGLDGRLGRHSPVDDGIVAMGSGGRDLSVQISVGIVEAHGGRLSVENGKGGNPVGFTFTIPVAVEASASTKPDTSRSAPSRHTQEGKGKILAFVQDPETSRYVRRILSGAGFATAVASDLEEAESIITTQKPHVILLEPPLPQGDGLEMLVHIGRFSGVPVIIVAGREWNQHIGSAFELGASDYVSKPFTSTELLARVNVALRRRSSDGRREPSVPYLLGDLTIDYGEREVSVAGRPVHLTATEYKLLVDLSLAAGRVSTHEQLLRRVWGPLYASDSRIVRTYIKELRQKLGDDATRPKYIFTEPGVGYLMPKPLIEQRLEREPS